MGLGIAFLLVGLMIGGLIGYLVRPDTQLKKKHAEMESALEQTKAEFSDYKHQVANHFLTTAELVNGMTESYRSVHEHLAQGANTLCSELVGVKQLDIKQTELLDKENPAPSSESLSNTDSVTSEQVEAVSESVSAEHAEPVSSDNIEAEVETEKEAKPVEHAEIEASTTEETKETKETKETTGEPTASTEESELAKDPEGLQAESDSPVSVVADVDAQRAKEAATLH